MMDSAKRRAIVNEMENLVHEDVGRNINALFAVTKGGLYRAASSIANAKRPCLGVMTGFFIPAGIPPSGETDGPLGAALLIAGLQKVGLQCRLITDEPCSGVCEAALKGAGSHIPLEVVKNGQSLSEYIEIWKRAGITHAFSIERCGRSADGTPRNMRGVDIGSYTAPLDDLFLGGPWVKLAVGDGGNEIGMGSIPRATIAQHVAHGDTIACVTPADHLIAAGVSNWGAYALLGALAILREDWRKAILTRLNERTDQTILETMVKDGPSVDGVTREQKMSVDGLPREKHHTKVRAIRKLVESV